MALRLIFLFLSTVSFALPLQAQIPETFTNLKVLPADITRPQLLAVMREWSTALGVRCEHCHVEREPEQRDGSEFALDEKRTKQTARIMFRMVREINGQHLEQLPEAGRLSVRCSTCHRGVERPEPIEDILWVDIQLEGISAAGQHYEKLREKYLENGAYDFSSRPLNDLSVRLAEEGQDLESAMALQRKNISWHPGDAYSVMLLGSLLEKAGRPAEALEAYRQALALEPESAWYQRRVERLERAMKESETPSPSGTSEKE